MNKNSFLNFWLLIVCIIFLAACGSAPNTENDSEDSEGDKKTFISIGTGGTGGTWYQIMAAASKVVNTNSDSINLDVQSTGGSVENMRLIGDGTADMGNTSPDTGYYAYKGEREFDDDEPIDNLRVVMAGNLSYQYIITGKDSEYKTIQDLEGATVSVGPPGSASEISAEAILDVLSIEVKSEYLAHSEASQALIDGDIDVMMAQSGVPMPAVTELAVQTDINFIDLNDEEINEVVMEHEYWSGGSLPANTFEGQDEDIPGINIGTLVMASKDLPNETINELLQILLKDGQDEWIKGHKTAEEYSIDTMQNYLDQGTILVPVHEGSIKFFEENGVKFPDS